MDYFLTYEYLYFNNASLFTVIYLPKKEGKFPTIIYRTPYANDSSEISEQEILEKTKHAYKCFVDRGYAVVFQHCRGRGKSGGDCIPYIYEREDGLHLQQWIRKQSFYNGELYLFGGSYTSSVHFVTVPFAKDIKGAILEIQDCNRYNCNYRNGFYKIGLHGSWYIDMYKHKSNIEKNYVVEDFNMLPLINLSVAKFKEKAVDFDEILCHPDPKDEFWKSRNGGGETINAIKHADIPILLVTGFYDIYTGGIFDMWNDLDQNTKAKSALVVHPYDHNYYSEGQDIVFEDGMILDYFKDYRVNWLDAIRNKNSFPFKQNKVTYYKLFEKQWLCDDFNQPNEKYTFILGDKKVTYLYDPNNCATFKGGLSTNFGGAKYQEKPNLRSDIVTVYTPVFNEDTFIKGKMSAKINVSSNCEDTCFYVRLSLVKENGDYGLRDDITQISNYDKNYEPNSFMDLNFSFDEHAFVVKKGEKIRIDISSSAFPLYVRHTNNKGLYCMQTTTKVAKNTIDLSKSTLTLYYVK